MSDDFELGPLLADYLTIVIFDVLNSIFERGANINTFADQIFIEDLGEHFLHQVVDLPSVANDM